MANKTLILDFGSQYTQLIARRVRELGVFSEIRPCTQLPEKDLLEEFQAVILSGGPSSVDDKDAPPFDSSWFSSGLPLLGICYGMQLMCRFFGAAVSKGESREYGYSSLEIVDNNDLFSGFSTQEPTAVWMSHGDHAKELPEGFQLLARSEGAPIAAAAHRKRALFGIQFHPEVFHTPRGKEIIANFLFKVAGLRADWSSEQFIDQQVKSIAGQIGKTGRAICAISGGVDSTVAAAIVSRAIGDRLHCVFVDNGLLRRGEAKEVADKLGRAGLGLNLTVVDAQARFLDALKGVQDPEEKRKVIGREFIKVFEEHAKGVQHATHLVQGTLYPDVIESVSLRGPSATIKTHHNVGGLPEKMDFKLIEPLKELFKDEVRIFGEQLGVPKEILRRQPFPGPGLAVRIVGEVDAEKIALLRHADAIFQEEIEANMHYDKLWQAFAVLLPVYSVGVMGDGRSYGRTIALRAVHSEDGMTADWAYLPEELLKRCSSRIMNEVAGINRVVLDISSKPPATIEWE